MSISPPSPTIASYWPLAMSCAATIWERTEWIESVRPFAVCTSACLADALVGFLERSDHAFQSLASCALMPFSPGSARESSALSSASAFADHSLTFVFWARYCESRNWSRMRRKPVTSTPEPSCAPVTFIPLETVRCCAGDACSVASWRE